MPKRYAGIWVYCFHPVSLTEALDRLLRNWRQVESAEDALFLEPSGGESGKIYTNYIIVKPENEYALFVEALCKCLNFQKVRGFILNLEGFNGGVIPTFP